MQVCNWGNMTMRTIEDLLDLERFPLDQTDSLEWNNLVEQCQAELESVGMYNLHGLLRDGIAEKAAAEIAPVMASDSFTHTREHHIYFLPEIPDLEPDHPALKLNKTVNHTVCADQIPGSIVMQIYAWQPFIDFLAATMGKNALHTMDDPLACANVMSYRHGEALNWHFDRSEFTTTLLLQSPKAGGGFEYRSDLRSDDDPNYDGVARMLSGGDDQIRLLEVEPGTLNVFKGKNTAHRVTPVEGNRDRMIAVFSYYERPGVMFSEAERVGFYGRAS